VRPPSRTSRTVANCARRRSSCLCHPPPLVIRGQRSAYAWVHATAPFSLTACSRRNDTGWHRTTPDDTGRHEEPGCMPGSSNLRIRCPKGRGSSTLPSRTTSDLRIFSYELFEQRAGDAVLLTLAHENFVSSSPGTRPGPRPLGRRPWLRRQIPHDAVVLIVETERGVPTGLGCCELFQRNPAPASACSSACLRDGRMVELTEGSRLGGRRGAEGPVPPR